VELHERWSRDYKRGVWPHHITGVKVKPFQMLEHWKQEDCKR